MEQTKETKNNIFSPRNNETETPRPRLKTPIYCEWCEIFICCRHVEPDETEQKCLDCKANKNCGCVMC